MKDKSVYISHQVLTLVISDRWRYVGQGGVIEGRGDGIIRCVMCVEQV